MSKGMSNGDFSRYQKWWRDGDNARRVLDKRALRYKNDPAYRRSIKESVAYQRLLKKGLSQRRGRSHNKPRMMSIKGEEIRTVSSGEASARLGISRSSLRRWEDSAILPCLFLRDPRRRRWYPEDIFPSLKSIIDSWKKDNDRSLISLKKRVEEDVSIILLLEKYRDCQ